MSRFLPQETDEPCKRRAPPRKSPAWRKPTSAGNPAQRPHGPTAVHMADERAPGKASRETRRGADDAGEATRGGEADRPVKEGPVTQVGAPRGAGTTKAGRRPRRPGRDGAGPRDVRAGRQRAGARRRRACGATARVGRCWWRDVPAERRCAARHGGVCSGRDAACRTNGREAAGRCARDHVTLARGGTTAGKCAEPRTLGTPTVWAGPGGTRLGGREANDVRRGQMT